MSVSETDQVAVEKRKRDESSIEITWVRYVFDQLTLLASRLEDFESSKKLFCYLQKNKMCGIFAAHGIENPSGDRAKCIACSKRIRHRGPDWSGCYVGQQSVLVHERLAIVGVGEFLLYGSQHERNQTLD